MIQDLVSTMNKMGYYPGNDFVPDGEPYRFDRHGKKKSGWVVAYQNHTRKGDPYIVAKFGDWATQEEEVYKTAVTFSKEDKKLIDIDIKKAQEKITVARQLAKEETAKSAEEIWANASENPKSEYLTRKKINGLYGAKTSIGSQGREIYVPMRDAENKIWGIQRILPDGTKLFMEGQRKESTFHVIPFSESLAEVDTIYIAEGFATAATIYEAIQKPVVVSFDSGNLFSVAKALKEKFKDKAIIICGDDDRFTTKPDGTLYNAGRESAEKAAKEVLGKAVFPKFKTDNGKLTDFNDLFLSEGIDEVKNQISGVKPEFHAVHCLGYQDDAYYFISSDKPQVTGISRGSFSKLSLLDLMPLPFWETNYPSRDGINWDGAIDNLMRSCRAKGPFKSKLVRGAGVWQDDGKTVVNTGSNLWVDGEIKNYREYKSKFVYQVANSAMIPGEDFATTEEMSKFANALERLSWKKPSSPKLLLGWMMAANITGSLKWRPHIWITGPSGSGKSFVINSIIAKLFKGNTTEMLGTTTEAGIRQSLGFDARPMIFDELETDDERSSERVKNIIELCRQACSETDAQIIKGSAHGKSLAFSIRFAAVVSSIRPNLQHEQDKNRFALLELIREKNDFTGETGIEKTFRKLLSKSFIEKFYSRSVHKLDLLLKNKEVIFNVMSSKYNSRFADQYGTMIAGYFAAMQDSVVVLEEATWAIDHLIDLSDEADDTVYGGADEDNLLSEVLESIVITQAGPRKILELIAEVVKPRIAMINGTVDLNGENFNNELQRYGLKVTEDKALAIYTNDKEFRKLIRNTKWKNSATKIAERINGAKVANLNFMKMQRKCVKVPLPESLVGVGSGSNP